jgi:hypothetical protein
LDFLGFPWILSRETRLINDLYGKTAEKFFSPLFPKMRVFGTELRHDRCGIVDLAIRLF